jgi:hypothetical protein
MAERNVIPAPAEKRENAKKGRSGRMGNLVPLPKSSCPSHVPSTLSGADSCCSFKFYCCRASVVATQARKNVVLGGYNTDAGLLGEHGSGFILCAPLCLCGDQFTEGPRRVGPNCAEQSQCAEGRPRRLLGGQVYKQSQFAGAEGSVGQAPPYHSSPAASGWGVEHREGRPWCPPGGRVYKQSQFGMAAVDVDGCSRERLTNEPADRVSVKTKPMCRRQKARWGKPHPTTVAQPPPAGGLNVARGGPGACLGTNVYKQSQFGVAAHDVERCSKANVPAAEGSAGPALPYNCSWGAEHREGRPSCPSGGWVYKQDARDKSRNSGVRSAFRSQYRRLFRAVATFVGRVKQSQFGVAAAVDADCRPKERLGNETRGSCFRSNKANRQGETNMTSACEGHWARCSRNQSRARRHISGDRTWSAPSSM